MLTTKKDTATISSSSGGAFGLHSVVPTAIQQPNNLPETLMKLLNDEVAADAIWWLPCGKAFAVNPETAPTKIFDIYFNGTKLSSFVRQLNKA